MLHRPAPAASAATTVWDKPPRRRLKARKQDLLSSSDAPHPLRKGLQAAMDPYFHSGFRHTRAYRRVGHRCALDLDIQNRQPLTIRQSAQHLRNVIFRLGGAVV